LSLKAKIVAPAVGLLVVAILSVLFTFLNLFGNVFNRWFLRMAENSNLPPEKLDPLREGIARGDFGVIHYLAALLNVCAALVIILGALRMMKQQSYGLAVTASILTLVPCIGTSICCCVIGVPVGVWALIVLMQTDVRAAFAVPRPQLG
jgi:hypothetical protein